MRIPKIVPRPVCLELRRALRKPHRHHRARQRIRHQHVRISAQHVLPVLVLIPESLKIQGRKSARRLPCHLKTDDVGKLVRDHVPKPGVRPSKRPIHIRDIDHNLVRVVIGAPVRGILIVPEFYMHLTVRLEIIQRGHRAVNVLRNLHRLRCHALQALVIVDPEMLGLHHLPL